MSGEIFISYARKDQEQAGLVVKLLQEQGYSVWMDEGNIEAAGLWSEQIVHAIRECRVLVLLVSRNSLASDNVHKEVMLASETRKKILPVYLEPCELTDRFRYQLAGIQHVEFHDPDTGKVLQKICASLEEETDYSAGAGNRSGITRDRPSNKLLRLGRFSFRISIAPIVIPLVVILFLLLFGIKANLSMGLAILLLLVVEMAALVTGIISRKTSLGKLGIVISSILLLLGLALVPQLPKETIEEKKHKATLFQSSASFRLVPPAPLNKLSLKQQAQFITKMTRHHMEGLKSDELKKRTFKQIKGNPRHRALAQAEAKKGRTVPLDSVIKYTVDVEDGPQPKLIITAIARKPGNAMVLAGLVQSEYQKLVIENREQINLLAMKLLEEQLPSAEGEKRAQLQKWIQQVSAPGHKMEPMIRKEGSPSKAVPASRKTGAPRNRGTT